jgi:cytochrome b561
MLLVIRICWRLKNILLSSAARQHKGQKNLEQKLALTAHILLYILVALLCFSGYFISTAGGRDVEFFSWFTLPPLPVVIENQEDVAGDWHYYFAWGLIALVVVHVFAALKHHFIDRDNTLKNMLKPSKIKKGKS